LIFLDTNVLLYACGIHDEDDPRTAMALEIVAAEESYAVSLQVIQEFFDNAIRPKRPRHLSVQEALNYIYAWRQFEVVPLTLALFDDAIAIRQRYKYRYWDCAILAAAIQAGCDTVYSEDMQHDQGIDGVRIVNPFRKD
jgi:predicted nucleic acid-binding protein